MFCGTKRIFFVSHTILFAAEMIIPAAEETADAVLAGLWSGETLPRSARELLQVPKWRRQGKQVTLRETVRRAKRPSPV